MLVRVSGASARAAGARRAAAAKAAARNRMVLLSSWSYVKRY
jgi:hypothetical protein